MLKLSYILPCYNVERYIKDCLDSIYAQDLKEDEFEVICVNDCSMDETQTIITEYSQKHSNLILINHKENLTAGGARNTGIEAAKGEYIWFVDPDDIIKPHSAKELCETIVDHNLEVLLFNFDDFDKNLHLIREDRTFLTSSEVYSGQEYISKFFPGKMNTFGIVWRCLFKTEFLRKENLRYPIMRKAQDVVFLWNVMLQAKRVESVENSYYNYRCNPYSVINKQTEAKVAFSDRVLRGYNIELMLQNHNFALLPIIKEDMIQTVRWCANSNLELISKMSKRELNLYYDEIIKNETAIKGVWSYMNRKSKMLFDVKCGKLCWIAKAFFLCKIKDLKKS